MSLEVVSETGGSDLVSVEIEAQDDDDGVSEDGLSTVEDDEVCNSEEVGESFS